MDFEADYGLVFGGGEGRGHEESKRKYIRGGRNGEQGTQNEARLPADRVAPPPALAYPYVMPPTVSVASLGCKLNQAEAEELTRRFVQAGYDVVDPDAGPDVYVLNTCTVTHVADRKSRQALRRARRANSNGAIVATGCYAQRAPEELDAIREVDLVVDNTDKMRLL